MNKAPSNDAAKLRGSLYQIEQNRIQRDRDAKAARDRAATDSAALAQQAEPVSFAEGVRRQRLGVVVAPTPAPVRAASVRIAAAVSAAAAPAWRKFRTDLAELTAAVDGLEARARERDLAAR